MATAIEVAQALQDKISALSATADPVQIAYLGKAFDSVSNDTLRIPLTDQEALSLAAINALATTKTTNFTSLAEIKTTNFTSLAETKTTNFTSLADDRFAQIDAIKSKFLQVVSFVTTEQGVITLTTSDQSTVPNIGLTIIPKGNGSYFGITVRWFGEVYAPWNVMANIHRADTRINVGGATNYWVGLAMPVTTYFNNHDSTPENVNFTTLDTTGSTIGVPIIYTLKFTSSEAATLYTNRSAGNAGASLYEAGSSEIIVVEYGA